MRISDWSSDVCSSDLYAPDQDPSRGDSVYVPFFGQPAHSLTSTHQLARMSCPAVVLFQHARRADGGYSLKLPPALHDFPSKVSTADTARVLAGLQAMARPAPPHFLCLHLRTSSVWVSFVSSFLVSVS